MSIIPLWSSVVLAFAPQPFYLASALALVVGRDDANITGDLGSADTGSGIPHIVEATIISFLVLCVLCLTAVHLFHCWTGFSKHIRWMFSCGSSTSPSNVPAAGRIPAPHLSRTVTSDSSSSTLTSSSAATAVDLDLQKLPKAHCPKKAHDILQTLQK